MVGVGMRVQHGVQPSDMVLQHLQAHLRRRVHQQFRPGRPSVTRIAGRSRVFFGSGDVQTAQSQPIIGTPCDVPLPRTVTFMPPLYPNRAWSGCGREGGVAGGLGQALAAACVQERALTDDEER